MNSSPDLNISAGRLYLDSGDSGPGALAVSSGRIAAIRTGGEPVGPATHCFPDGVLLPGMVDLHAHPGLPSSRYAVDPDVHMLPHGVTTVMSQGEAGAATIDRYREDLVERCRTRVRVALNLARRGEEYHGYPCLGNIDEANVAECVAAARANADLVWGISVNTSRASCGESDPREVMRRALLAADTVGLPLLVGTRRWTDWPLDDQLPLLRRGDVLTYCFHEQPENLLAEGRVRDSVRQARERGVLFDIGHGAGSFSFPVAEACLAQGFPPDTISTDFYRAHVGKIPPHDLPRVLSCLIAAGLPEQEAFARVTSRPAAILGLSSEAGSMEIGRPADLCVLRWNPAAAPLEDCHGNTRPSGCWEPALTVIGGEVVLPTPNTQHPTPNTQHPTPNT